MMSRSLGKVVKTKILPCCGWFSCWLVAFLLATTILNLVDMKTHLFRNEDTVLMPEEITSEWLEETLSTVFYLGSIGDGSGSYEIITDDDVRGCFKFLELWGQYI
jgi:hypothetical protein